MLIAPLCWARHRKQMLPPLLIFLAAMFGSLAGTTAWHVISGTADWRMFGVLVSGSIVFTLFGAGLLFCIRLALLQSSRPIIGITLALTGAVFGALMLSGLGRSGICLVDACYDGYLVGALYGGLTALPLIFIRPAVGLNP